MGYKKLTAVLNSQIYFVRSGTMFPVWSSVN